MATGCKAVRVYSVLFCKLMLDADYVAIAHIAGIMVTPIRVDTNHPVRPTFVVVLQSQYMHTVCTNAPLKSPDLFGYVQPFSLVFCCAFCAAGCHRNEHG